MASIDTEERKGNLTRKGRVVAYTPESAKTAVTRDAGLIGAEQSLIEAAQRGDYAGIDPIVYGLGGSPTQRAAATYTAMGGRAPQLPRPAGMDYAALLRQMLGGGGGGGNALDWAKFRYQQQQDAAEAARAARTLEAMQQRYTSGAYGENIDKILGLIGQQGQMAETDVKNTFDRALANIQGGYDTASRLTGEGYGALQQYLQSTPYNPYGDVQVSAGIAPDAMENLLSAYGVSAEPVRAQVAAEQQAAEAGAAGFQNLLNVLGGVAEAGQGSRLAELAMAQNLAQTGLAEQRAGYGTAAEQARANALAQLAQAMMSARIDEERRRGQLADELANAIIAAGGTPNQGTGGGGAGGDGGDDSGKVLPGETIPLQQAIQALAAAQGMAAPTGQSEAALRRQLEAGFLR